MIGLSAFDLCHWLLKGGWWFYGPECMVPFFLLLGVVMSDVPYRLYADREVGQCGAIRLVDVSGPEHCLA